MSRKLIALVVSTGLLTAGAAYADHNSKNGEGWANMPNDIHNTRIETREADDNEAFRDFVRYGEGAESENRFATDDAGPNQAMEQKGNANGTRQQDGSATKNQNAVQTKVEDQKRVETRSRIHQDTASASQRSRSATSSRGGTRKGGGKR
jgi:hypothetical protein